MGLIISKKFRHVFFKLFFTKAASNLQYINKCWINQQQLILTRPSRDQPITRGKFEITSQNPNFSIINQLFIEII